MERFSRLPRNVYKVVLTHKSGETTMTGPLNILACAGKAADGRENPDVISVQVLELKGAAWTLLSFTDNARQYG